MAIIGSFGDTVFECSERRVLSFGDFSRDGSARIGSHDIIGKEPLVEFLGPGGETINFTMQLLSSLGVDPLYECERLRRMMKLGKANLLVIGGKPVGESNIRWIIESLGEAHVHHQPVSGQPIEINLAVSLRRYVVMTAARDKTVTPLVEAAVKSLFAGGVKPALMQDKLDIIGDVAVGASLTTSGLPAADEEALKATPAGTEKLTGLRAAQAKLDKATHYTEMAQNYGEILKSGSASLADLQKFVDKGVPMVSELAAQMNVTETQLNTILGTTNLPTADLDKALGSLARRYGKFSSLLGQRTRSANRLFGGAR